MIESSVDLTEGGFDLIGIANCAAWWIGSEGGQRAEQAEPEFDEQDSQFESEWSEPIAASATDAFDEALGTQFRQVVAELAKSVV
jgi:hypothetical protein